jgi:FtsP/CotA-like multicopper oxidase with cupredoxin domain
LGAAGGVGLALRSPHDAIAANGRDATEPYVPRPGTPQYVLRIAATTLDPDGRQPVASVTANGTFPGPEIRVRRGDQLRVVVENQLDDDATSIHWHGLLVPAAMDGVPDVSNRPIASRRTYVYEFPIRQSGTYWYHSHWRLQEQIGLAGPFVIEDDEPAKQRDAVVVLSDWLHRSPYEVLAGLGEKTAASTPMAMGGKTPAAPMAMNGGAKADLADITYDAFLLNGRGNNAPWTMSVEPGEKIRLRVINAGASTYFRLRLDGHPLEVTHADGIAVEPVTVDYLLMGMAECYDVTVALAQAGSYTLHAVAQDGSGQAVGVLHTRGVVPKVNLEMPKFDGRALSYSMLRATAPTTLPAGPTRTFRLALQGDMKRYVWTIDGQVYPKADPLLIRQGEQVQIELVNETMMWHPMHLHGHFFRLLQGAGELSPLKHTVNVAPRETVKIEFGADNPGAWIFHCHNLYHFEAGMARVFEYEV